jgi:hypothetical protein
MRTSSEPSATWAKDVTRAPQQLLALGGVVRERRPGQEVGAAHERIGSTGGTGPLSAPKSTSIPRGRSEARLASKVEAPTRRRRRDAASAGQRAHRSATSSRS